MKSADVLDVLVELMLTRGVPRHIRSGNGPEFIATAIRRLLKSADIQTLYIEPGAPWQIRGTICTLSKHPPDWRPLNAR